MQDRLAGLGVDIRTGCAVSRVARNGARRWSVALDGETREADLVVLALDVPGLQAVVAASPDLGDPSFRRSVEGLAVTHPFAVWRLWLDRRGKPGRLPFVGTTGVGSLDNISLYHLFEDESRSWAERTGGPSSSSTPTPWSRARRRPPCARTSGTRSTPSIPNTRGRGSSRNAS